MESQSSIYAELLSNIRQISLAVSLSSSGADTSTQVAINADGTEVELRHHGESHKLELPAKVSLGGTILPIQKQGLTTLSWRLPLHHSGPSTTRQTDTLGDQAVPWSAADLQNGTDVVCTHCRTAIVNASVITWWKDLPSENWAEMMEFWHCHKPDDAHDHAHSSASHEPKISATSPVDGHGEKADEKSLAARGYGASSIISAQQGVGFVDLTSLMFAESDCAGLTFSASTFEHGSPNRQNVIGLDGAEIKSLNVFCSSCQEQIGFFNLRTAAVMLLKWQVRCHSLSGTFLSISECLAATLISTISRSGSSKSLIMPIPGTVNSAGSRGTTTETVVHIWVLNSNIVYSSSAAVVKDVPGIHAIKLLYRLIQREEADKMLEGVTCDGQEINMPSDAIGKIIKLLDESSSTLPASERVFKEWKVGLLSR